MNLEIEYNLSTSSRYLIFEIKRYAELIETITIRSIR
nr:MAG TPA: hypothetical protein [Bacteriophage sp.]DAT50644.1 MAG TPA: hypothetical protein [Bacteriophage sp.]DAU82360.1 MAG TPA: hypothetical protein [Bacteriophage sp.]DAW65971.1 MAG TPA: hypothetical protein [Bacteriophage sp.]DAW96081.1 MAG TPA: hypothetical protein [Bacteriophage sp.]